jgi:hypothetical protein
MTRFYRGALCYLFDPLLEDLSPLLSVPHGGCKRVQGRDHQGRDHLGIDRVACRVGSLWWTRLCRSEG